MARARQSKFRSWLVDRVSEVKIDTRVEGSLEARARYLGVQPDVLEEADALRRARIDAVGRIPNRRGVHTANYDSYTRPILLYLPQEIVEATDAVCAGRNIDFHTLARAAVHTLLSGPNNPQWVGKGWMFHGVRYGASNQRSRVTKDRRYAVQRQFLISVGADIALTRRAERLGVTKTGLVRGAISDVLDGRTRQLIYVDTSSMWRDPNRYWTGDLQR